MAKDVEGSSSPQFAVILKVVVEMFDEDQKKKSLQVREEVPDFRGDLGPYFVQANVRKICKSQTPSFFFQIPASSLLTDNITCLIYLCLV